MTYPDGEVVTYHYDEAGQVYSLTSNKNGSESVIVDRIGYDKDGHTVYTKLGNGTETEYTYDDARQRLQEMKLAFDGSDIMHNKYSYDAVDNILGIANTVNPQELSNNSAKLGGESSHTYQYDALNRLISASGKAKDASYTLDMAYNVMSMPVPTCISTRMPTIRAHRARLVTSITPTMPTETLCALRTTRPTQLARCSGTRTTV